MNHRDVLGVGRFQIHVDLVDPAAIPTETFEVKNYRGDVAAFDRLDERGFREVETALTRLRPRLIDIDFELWIGCHQVVAGRLRDTGSLTRMAERAIDALRDHFANT